MNEVYFRILGANGEDVVTDFEVTYIPEQIEVESVTVSDPTKVPIIIKHRSVAQAVADRIGGKVIRGEVISVVDTADLDDDESTTQAYYLGL